MPSATCACSTATPRPTLQPHPLALGLASHRRERAALAERRAQHARPLWRTRAWRSTAAAAAAPGASAAAWSSLSGPVNKPRQTHSPLAPLARVSVCASRRPGREERDGWSPAAFPAAPPLPTAPVVQADTPNYKRCPQSRPSIAVTARRRARGLVADRSAPRRRRTRPARALRTARAPLHRCLTRGRPGSPSRHDLLACLHEHCRTWHSVFSIGQILT